MTDRNRSSSVERPEPAHHNDGVERHGSSSTYQPGGKREQQHNADDAIEATELRDYDSRPSSSGANRAARENGNADGGFHDDGVEDPSLDGQMRPDMRRIATSASHRDDSGLRKFWRRQISISVPHEDCRDHLACERTFLGYLRTSVALSMVGVTIAQLFRLDQDPNPSDTIAFFDAGPPLSSMFIVSAILVALLGGWRFWRLQNAMVRRKVIAAGWEFHAISFIVGSTMLVVFAIVMAVDLATPDPKNGGGGGDGD